MASEYFPNNPFSDSYADRLLVHRNFQHLAQKNNPYIQQSTTSSLIYDRPKANSLTLSSSHTPSYLSVVASPRNYVNPPSVYKPTVLESTHTAYIDQIKKKNPFNKFGKLTDRVNQSYLDSTGFDEDFKTHRSRSSSRDHSRLTWNLGGSRLASPGTSMITPINQYSNLPINADTFRGSDYFKYTHGVVSFGQKQQRPSLTKQKRMSRPVIGGYYRSRDSSSNYPMSSFQNSREQANNYKRTDCFESEDSVTKQQPRGNQAPPVVATQNTFAGKMENPSATSINNMVRNEFESSVDMPYHDKNRAHGNQFDSDGEYQNGQTSWRNREYPEMLELKGKIYYFQKQNKFTV